MSDPVAGERQSGLAWVEVRYGDGEIGRFKVRAGEAGVMRIAWDERRGFGVDVSVPLENWVSRPAVAGPLAAEGTVSLPLPVHLPVWLLGPDGEPVVEVGQAGLHLSEDGTRLLFSAVLRGLGQVAGVVPVPVVGQGSGGGPVRPVGLSDELRG